MSEQKNNLRVRATTYASTKLPEGAVSGLVLRVKGDDVKALISELQSSDVYGSNGATLFITTYENQSRLEGKENETYLSSTIGVIATDSDKPEVKKQSIGNQIKNAYENKSGGSNNKFQSRK